MGSSVGKPEGLETKIRRFRHLQDLTGGESGIRTHETFYRLHAFQACAFSRSAISPQGRDSSAQAKKKPASRAGFVALSRCSACLVLVGPDIPVLGLPEE